MSWIETRQAELWQIKNLIHQAERSLDAFEGSALVPPEALAMAKALECAASMAENLVKVYISECFERANGSS